MSNTADSSCRFIRWTNGWSVGLLAAALRGRCVSSSPTCWRSAIGCPTSPAPTSTARCVWRSFVEIMSVAGRDVDRAVARRCHGHARRLHHYRASLREYRAASRCFAAAGLEVEAARTAIGSIDALTNLGLYREAIRTARRARAVFERAGEPKRVARLDVNLANLLVRIARQRAALTRYEAAEAVFARLDADVDLALTRFNRARALIALDRHHEALPLYQSSADTWRAHGMDAALCQCRIELGDVFYRLGRLTEALDTVEQATQVAGALEDRELDAIAIMLQARIEAAISRRRPTAPLDRAIEAFGTLMMPADQAEVLALRAEGHLRAGRIDPARADLEQAEAIFRRIGNRPRQWWVRFRLALVGRTQVDPVVTQAALRRCIAAFRRAGQRAFEVEARLALIETDPDRRGQGPALERVASLLEGFGDPWLDYRGALAQARHDSRRRRHRPARRELERAYRIVQQLRGALPLEADRAFFMTDKHRLAELALELARDEPASAVRRSGSRSRSIAPVDLDPDRWAFLWSERSHLPRLRDVWNPGLPPSIGVSEIESHTARALEEARERLHALDQRERSRRIHPLPIPASARERERTHWRKRRSAMARHVEQLFHRLERQAALRLGAPHSREPDPARIQASLAPDETLIEYFVGAESIHAFRVQRDALSTLRLPVSPKDAMNRVRRLRAMWDRYRLGAEFVDRHGVALDRTAAELLAELERMLWEPLTEGLDTGGRWIVVPHRWLHGVPFHAFSRSTAPIRYALSAQSLIDSPPTGRARGRALIVGHATVEAPAAEREAVTIGRMYGDCEPLIGAAATPDAVRREWSQAPLIHVAGHAGVNVDDPRLSGIELAGGAWTVYDLYASSTRADLVVLGACQTGESVLWGTDDAIGLLPGLFLGGARSAVVSLWPVDDAVTHDTMSRLHEHLLSGMSSTDALFRSREAVRADHPSPYHWAPFVLYGADLPGGSS
jgi:tetratricopeptide (TPR) repeat protein